MNEFFLSTKKSCLMPKMTRFVPSESRNMSLLCPFWGQKNVPFVPLANRTCPFQSLNGVGKSVNNSTGLLITYDMNSNTGLLNLITISFLFSCSYPLQKRKKRTRRVTCTIENYGGFSPRKKVKCWKSSERVGNEINSSTVLVGNLPHVMP